MSLYENKQSYKLKIQLKEDNFEDWLLELSVMLLALHYSIDEDAIYDDYEYTSRKSKVKQEDDAEESKQDDERKLRDKRKRAAFLMIFSSISQKLRWLVRNINIKSVDLDGLWLAIYQHFKSNSIRGKLSEVHKYLGTEMGEGESFDRYVENLRAGQRKVNNMKLDGIEITDMFQVFMLTFGVLKHNHQRFHSSVVLLEKQIKPGGISFDEAVAELRVVAQREEEREKEVIALAAQEKKRQNFVTVKQKNPHLIDCHNWKAKGTCAYEERTGNTCRFKHDEDLGRQQRDREARKIRDPTGRVIGKKSNSELVCTHCKGSHLPSKCPNMGSTKAQAQENAHAAVVEIVDEDVGFHPDE